MKKLTTVLTASVLTLTALLSAPESVPPTEASAAGPLKIMPIGDSITFGLGDTGGYRKHLDRVLKEKGIEFDLVGPEGKNEATFSYNGRTLTYDDNNAGYSGFTIKQHYPIPSWGENGLLERLKQRNAFSAQPDIVLLIIGTNDMTANRNLNDCSADLHSLLDYMLESIPQESMIFIGSIPEFTEYGGNPTRVGNYNNTVKTVAESYEQDGKNVRFADVHGCLDGMNDIGSDRLHPNAGGYEKMGVFWANVIEEYLGEGQPVDDSPLVFDFENGLSGWSGRGSASADISSEAAAGGNSSAAVTGRAADWNGIAYTVSTRKFPAGTEISVLANVMQKSGEPVHFKMTMQYTDSDGKAVYDTFAEADAASGEWKKLVAATYTVPEGKSPVLYFETDGSKCDFYLDDVTIMKADGSIVPPEEDPPVGDIDGSGTTDLADVKALRDYLTTEKSEINAEAADLDQNGRLDVTDLSLLKRVLLPES